MVIGRHEKLQSLTLVFGDAGSAGDGSGGIGIDGKAPGRGKVLIGICCGTGGMRVVGFAGGNEAGRSMFALMFSREGEVEMKGFAGGSPGQGKAQNS